MKAAFPEGFDWLISARQHQSFPASPEFITITHACYEAAKAKGVKIVLPKGEGNEDKEEKKK